jgi:hypothetical protein
MRRRITCAPKEFAAIAGNIAAAIARKMAEQRRNQLLCPLFGRLLRF